jgi:HD superfamily phosphodiesterase
MEKESFLKEKKAIEKGMEWMMKSVDPVHDIVHAENVADHSLKIYSSLKESGWNVEEVDENLILLCAYWHDCFKAGCELKTFLNEVLEGVRSAKIAQEELKNLVSSERLSLVLSAIRNHNNILFLFFFRNSLPALTQILIEADALDAKSFSRVKLRNSSSRTFFHKAGVFFAQPVVNFLQGKYIKSPYAKCQLRSMTNKEKQ